MLCRIGNRAIAMDAVSLVVIIALLLFVSAAVVIGWINVQNLQASQAACSAKLVGYCSEWSLNNFQNVPYNWNTQSPTDCDKDPIKISQPSLQQCKNLIGQK